MRVSSRSVVFSLVLLVVGAAFAWAADPPYAGNWKLNPDKSDFGETTMTYEEVADGKMKFSADGQSYEFKADGNDYPTPWGSSSAWNAVDERTWKVTTKVNEKVVGTSTLTVAADGKTLTVDAKNIDAAGNTSKNTVVYERLSGGQGMAGQWKTKNVQIGSPGTLSISPSGSNGLTLSFVEQDGSCSAKFDGKDYPATGPMWPSGWTCAIAKNGATGLDATWKKDGKLMFKDTFTPSADGKTLTDVSSTPGTNEKVETVYDRQ